MNLKYIKYIIIYTCIILLASGCSNDTNSFEIDLKTFEKDYTKSKQEESDNEKQANFAKNSSKLDDGNFTLVSSSSCSLDGNRVANAKVDIGYDSTFATRDYWAYTNEYSQLFYVTAEEIVLQNDLLEIGDDNRYCDDEAKVPGTEATNLDEGHVIADSLGGASNAYNITPQESDLNRYGTQADIEEDIRDHGGATNFEAIIQYPNSKTQIPSMYTISYTVNGNDKSYTFANDYDGTNDSQTSAFANDNHANQQNKTKDNVYYDNCTAVRNAGAAPIYRGDPGYSSKLDRDGDEVACE